MEKEDIKRYEERKMKTEQLFSLFSNKRTLFVTTKGTSYLRNTQECTMLEEKCAAIYLAGSDSKSYFVRVLKAYWESIKTLASKRVERVFIGFAPQLMLPLLWICKIGGKSVSIDFFISMYDTFVCDRKRIRETSVTAKILHWIDRKTLSLADYYISDTKAHKDYFVEEFGADPQKGAVLYLKADDTIYYPMQIEKPVEWKDKFVVLYFGSVLPLQGIPVVLEAIRQCTADDRIRFVFVGPLEKSLHVDTNQYANTAFYSWLSQEELAKKIAMADLCLAGHFNSEISKAKRTIAGKTYIYRAMGKPVILGDNAANRELFEEEKNQIYFVEMGNATALAKLIKHIVDDWSNVQ